MLNKLARGLSASSDRDQASAFLPEAESNPC